MTEPSEAAREPFRPPERPLIHPGAQAVGEVTGMRLRDLRHYSKRLGRLQHPPKGRPWEIVALLLGGAAAGGAIGGIPVAGTGVEPVYWAVVIATALVAGLCWLAGRTARQERAESVSAIKEDFDDFLDAYAPHDT